MFQCLITQNSAVAGICSEFSDRSCIASNVDLTEAFHQAIGSTETESSDLRNVVLRLA